MFNWGLFLGFLVVIFLIIITAYVIRLLMEI